MADARKIYRFLNVLSIDVSAGAMVCALFFGDAFGAVIRPLVLIVLGLSVWIIYSADHLLDAWRIGARAATDRHRFHQQYFTALIVTTGLVFFLDAGMILFLRPALLRAGLLLSLIVATYLIVQHYLVFLKEFLGALLYTSGVVLPVLISFGNRPLTAGHWALILSFMLIAWINLLLFSLFDKESDERNKQVSFTTITGKRNTRYLIMILFAINLLLYAYLFSTSVVKPALILFSMSLVLMMLLLFRNYFSENDRFRYVGDAIFLFPLAGFIP